MPGGGSWNWMNLKPNGSTGFAIRRSIVESDFIFNYPA